MSSLPRGGPLAQLLAKVLLQRPDVRSEEVGLAAVGDAGSVPANDSVVTAPTSAGTPV